MSSDHDQNQTPVSNSTTTVDLPDYIKIVQNPDGTTARVFNFPCTPAASDPSSPVLTKDVPVNPTHGTWVRMFMPSYALECGSSTTKLPLVVYYHGGGFIMLSASSSVIHEFCHQMATKLAAIVISVDYRLAPQHRLPAAYDDAVEALHWMKSTDEVWLRQFADFSKCFLTGTSAGGNIAYYAGLRASVAIDDFTPLKIKGLVLHHPFFGGVKRTGSEMRLINDPILPLSSCDRLWDLALPIGVDRDHEFCNPMATEDDHRRDDCDRIRALGWQVLVIGCDGDPLIDRQIELARMLRKKEVQVITQFKQGEYHGVEVTDPSKAESLFVLLKDFIECN